MQRNALGWYTLVIPWWTMILPGEQGEVDLPPMPGETVPAGSSTQFDVWHHRVLPGFVFARWSYNDLGRDPTESYNVVDRHPDVAQEVLGFIERWEQDWLANPRGWK